jgi:hypothetical protein
MAVAAIAAFHNKAGFASPTHDPRIKLGLSGLQRSQGRIARQAEPMTRQTLRRIVRANLGGAMDRRATGPEPSRQAWRNTWFEVVAFLSVSRFSDLQQVTKGDILISEGEVVILFRSEKNDKVHRGHRAVLTATGDEFCPVRLTRRYLARLPPSPGTPMLPAWRSWHRRAGEDLPCIKYDAMRKAQKLVVVAAGYGPEVFGLHSGRVGGSIALYNAGWDWPEIAAYGGWAPGSREPEKYTKKAMRKTRCMAKSIHIFRIRG